MSLHRRFSWARLLATVLSTDVTTCACGGRLRPLDATRLHLHAHRLRFEHPVTGEPVDLRSALPTWAIARDDESAADGTPAESS